MNLQLKACWYVGVVVDGYTHVAGVFWDEDGAVKCIESARWEGLERYIRQGVFATADGETGVLADSPRREVGRTYPAR